MKCHFDDNIVYSILDKPKGYFVCHSYFSTSLCCGYSTWIASWLCVHKVVYFKSKRAHSEDHLAK